MRSRNDYDRAFAVIREVVSDWDPLSLLSMGSPADEWDREIASLVGQIPRIASPIDAAHAVSRIFSASLYPDGFEPEACAEVGQRLYARLVAAGLVMPCANR
ncbi:MAG: hypothetical protein QM754_07590 [Tepidisphaeraceae bacterium]